jgi:hypothetical protein
MITKIISIILIEKSKILMIQNIFLKILELKNKIKKNSNINRKDQKNTINTIHIEKKGGVMT